MVHLLSKVTKHIGVGVAGYQRVRTNIIVNYSPRAYDPHNYEASLPEIADSDVKLAKTKWQKIEKELNPPDFLITFKDELLPGWESTLYPKENDKSIQQ